MNFSIRRAGLADIDRIAPLFDAYRSFYGQPCDLARARAWLHERLANGEATVLMADLDGHAIGFTLLYPFWSSVATGRVLVLNDLYVDPVARRGGVARALLDAAAKHGRDTDALRLVLETAADNHAAQALYRHAGWSQEDTRWFRLPLAASLREPHA